MVLMIAGYKLVAGYTKWTEIGLLSIFLSGTGLAVLKVLQEPAASVEAEVLAEVLAASVEPEVLAACKVLEELAASVEPEVLAACKVLQELAASVVLEVLVASKPVVVAASHCTVLVLPFS
jgi:hypothetical protein